MMKKQPKTRIENIVDTLHSQEIIDPYRWIEEDTPERSAWIKEQNDYTNARLKRIKGRPEIRKRLEELLLVNTVGAPSTRDDKIFFYKYRHDQQHSVLFTRDWPDGEERVLLDPNQLSEDGSIALARTSITRDGKLMAYGLNKEGSDWFHLRIMDIDTGADLPDEIPRLAYTGITWLPDNSGFFYSRSEHTEPEKLTKTNQRVFFHKLGTDWYKDELIFGDESLKEHESPSMRIISGDGKHAILSVSKGYSHNELYYMNLTGKRKIISITGDAEGQFSPKINNSNLYVLTDNKAPNYRLCVVSLDDGFPTINKWATLIEEDKDATLYNFSVFNDRLFIDEVRDVATRIKEYSLEGKLRKEVELPTLGSASIPYGREEMDAVFLSFSSFFHPQTTYKYDFSTGELTEFTKNEYPFDPNQFTTEQVWFRSKDNTEVPMFVIRRKDLELNGKNPTILTGYGGFNSGKYPYFSASRIQWLEKGGIIAVANLRGGDEFGEEWHKAGMLGKKQNVFDDFIAAGEALIGENPSRLSREEENSQIQYTNTNQLGISGGSNGGLLVGAALVQRPDLWAAVDCDVPLLDMLRYHFTEGAKYWISEYGNPDNPEHFSFLHTYSPYHNVNEGTQYPTTMFTTSLGDDRGVDPMHAMKMAARVQANNASNNQILLHVKEKTGHGHSKPMKMVIEELVDYYAFMSRHLKM